jgi:hypothetical protein
VHPLFPHHPDHPELVVFGRDGTRRGTENIYHSDVSWREIPSMGSMLRCLTCPEVGGDTIWVNMAAAYANLAEDVKARIARLKAVHDALPLFGQTLTPETYAQVRKQYPPMAHPVVRTHPEPGEKILYVNEAFTMHLANYADENPFRIGSDFRFGEMELLQFLMRQAAAPDYQVRLRWRPDTIALWETAPRNAALRRAGLLPGAAAHEPRHDHRRRPRLRGEAMTFRYQPAKAWGITALLLVFMAINFADKIAVGLMVVPMMSELQLSPTRFGLVGSSFFWLFAIAGIGGGFLANRVATTGLLLAMGLLWSVLQIPMALSTSLALLVLGRVLLGIAEGPAWPVAVHACYKWFPNERRELPVALLAQGGAIGLLGAGIVMPLVTAHWGWRANFYLLSALGFAWGLLWIAFGREGDGGGAEQATAAVSVRVTYRRILLEPTVLACFGM